MSQQLNYPTPPIVTIEAAEIMAARINQKVGTGSGGFCVFGADGSGGYWYTANQRPQFGPDEVKVYVPWRPTTAAAILADLTPCG